MSRVMSRAHNTMTHTFTLEVKYAQIFTDILYIIVDDVFEELTLRYSDLGIYKNLAEDATVSPSTEIANLKDLTLSSCVTLTTGTSYVFTLKAVSGDDTDSYGIKKIILYSDTSANLAGWKVAFNSLEQNKYVECASSLTTAPTNGATNVTIDCVPNARTKSIKIIVPDGGSYAKKLCEVVIAGLESHKYACDVGWKSTSGYQPCTACASGSYGSEANKCADCPAGKFSKYTAFDPIINCTECSAGTYSNDKASECTDCPKGSISATNGSSECTKCSVGEYQSEAKQTTCEECPEGQYSGAEGADACTPCEVGKYSDTKKSSTCASCGKGTYNGETGRTSCDQCEPGSYADSEGLTKCKPCDPGLVTNNKGSFACTKCAVGEYQALSGETVCDKCKVGTFAKTEGTATCEPCPKGYITLNVGSTECSKCPVGKFVDETGSTTCKLCSEGEFQDEEGQDSCKKCTDGTTSAAGASKCTSCQKGQYLNSDTMTCENCYPGTYTADEGSTACVETGINQYQDDEKATTYKECSAGQIAPNKGAIKCDLCDRGTYRTLSDSTCQPCTAGKYADQKGSAECKECPAGHYSTAGTIDCYECSVGEYQDDPGKEECKACPPGYFSSTTGLKQCEKCPADTYNTETGAFTCTGCTYGTFQPVPGNTSCIECPKRAAYQPVSCPPVIPKCPKLIYTNQYGTWEWPEDDPPDHVKDAVQVFRTCKYKLGGAESYGQVSRKCITWEDGTEQKSNWTSASYSACGTAESEKIHEIQKNLEKEMAELKKKQEAAAAGEKIKLSPQVSQNILTSLTSVTKGKDIGAADSANVVSALAAVSESVDLTNTTNRDNMLDAINSFADKDPSFIADSGGDTTSQAVDVVENIGASLLTAAANSGGDSDATPAHVVTPTMTIASTPINEKSKTEVTALSFGDDDTDEDGEDKGSDEESEAPLQPATEAPEIIQAPVDDDVVVPATMDPLEKAKELAAAKVVVKKQPKKVVKVSMPPLAGLIKKKEDGSEPAGLVCVVFKTANLFPTNDTSSTSEIKETVASNVVLLALGDEQIDHIDPPLKLNFTKEEPLEIDESTETVNYKCVYYIPATKEWSSKGCVTLKTNKSFGGMVECSCDHMTSFAVLMSVEPIPDDLANIQSAITNPLIGLSLLSLCLMVGMILPIKSLRSTRSMKIHLSLAGSQIFAIFVFLLTNFITPSSPSPLCEIVAMLIHYAYLVVFMWTIVESVIMYISLVQVFGGHISKYMLKFNLFCWSLPILSPITSYFLTDTDLLMKKKCVVKPSISKYSFILPIAVVLLINTYIFFALLKVILKAKSADKSATENAMKQLKAVASISCLLGLGWMVSFFGFGPLAPYCQFAFIIINGSQGIMMFMFYCLLNDQFIDEWREKFGLEKRIPNKTTTSNAPTSQQTGASVVQSTTNVTQAPVTQAAPRPTPAPTASKPKKEEPVKDVVYENNMADNVADNIYDTLDDPDIGSMNPATITRI